MIIIYVNKNAIMTGILFYCIEHFLYISKYSSIKLCVIFDGDINIIKKIIEKKYNISSDELQNIISIKPLDLLKYSTNKAMVLDTDTYNMIRLFIGKIKKIFLYSNDGNHNARSCDNVYGFYNYQKFNIKERFKIGFEFMKPKKPTINKTFCSHPLNGKINKKLIEETAIYDVLYKDFSHDLDIFRCKEIIYYHTHYLDRNNRIIPEAFWFGNKITLINTDNTDDSVNERYNTCLNAGVSQFNITSEYKVIKDFLKYEG